MLVNIIFGFLFPWILGIILYKKNKKIVLLITPIGISLACIINIIGFDLNFWAITPIKFNVFAALPIEMGLYPVLSCSFIYLIHHKEIKPYLLILTFTLFTTSLEFLAVTIGKVIYYNKWNILFTTFSYFIPYVVIYWYYISLRKLNLLK